jgi:hypothetical protein
MSYNGPTSITARVCVKKRERKHGGSEPRNGCGMQTARSSTLAAYLRAAHQMRLVMETRATVVTRDHQSKIICIKRVVNTDVLSR